MNNERYTLEQAEEEAARMREKIKTGEAKDYNEAERLVEKEKNKKRVLIKKSDVSKPADKLLSNQNEDDVFDVISREQLRRISLSPDAAKWRSGTELEIDIFGRQRVPVNSAEYETEFLRLGGRYGKEIKEDIIGHKEAFFLVKKFQPWNPSDPSRDFARRLREKVIEKLELNSEEAKKIKLYSARGSHLDWKGVDGFMELEDEEGIKRVTFDASLIDKPEIKADILIGDFPDPKENEQAYLEMIDSYANETAVRIRAASYEKPYEISKFVQTDTKHIPYREKREKPDINRYKDIDKNL